MVGGGFGLSRRAAAVTPSLFPAAEVRALLELGIRNHGRYLTEGEYRGILACVVEYENTLRRIANADLPPDKRPGESNWSPSFWKWAPKLARKALGMRPYSPRWGWNDLG